MRTRECMDASVHSCMCMHAQVCMYVSPSRLGGSWDFLATTPPRGSGQAVLHAAQVSAAPPAREESRNVASSLAHPLQEEQFTLHACEMCKSCVSVKKQVVQSKTCCASVVRVHASIDCPNGEVPPNDKQA